MNQPRGYLSDGMGAEQKGDNSGRAHFYYIPVNIFKCLHIHLHKLSIQKYIENSIEREKQNQHLSGLTVTGVASKQARTEQKPG